MASGVKVESAMVGLCLDGKQPSGDEEPVGAGGYRFDSPEDKEAIKQQRAAVVNWLKSMGSNMFFEGINLTKISLPVEMFEPRSFLERLPLNWEFLGLLTAAAEATDPVDRMKYVVAFAIGGLCRQVSPTKPFNPILGETYQAKFDNGVEVFAEQISHHPPVSSWQLVDPHGKFQFCGNGNWSAAARANSIKGRQSGVNCITFEDGSKITYELPAMNLKGTLWGERTLKYQGEMRFEDAGNDLVCEVLLDPQVSQTWGSWLRGKKSVKPDQVKGALKQGDKVLDTLSGSWLSYLEWEGGVGAAGAVRVWERVSTPRFAAQPVSKEVALYSDCRLRGDLVALLEGNNETAQQQKTALEEAQRRDRKLRKEGGGQEH